MTKVFKAFLVLSVVLMAFSSCKKKLVQAAESNDGAEKSAANFTIGFSIDTLAIERWRRDCDVFLNTAKDLGADVIVQNAGNSVQEQQKQIGYLINRNVKAIVIVPKQADSLTECIRLAKSKNIPVISYDRLILNADISLYITVDSKAVGTLMAKELLTRNSKGKWFCFYGPQEDYNMSLIKRGVENQIKGAPVSISLVYYTDGWNYDLSYQKMIELIKEKNLPDVIVAGNDAVANSIIQALGEFYPENNILIGGQDADIAGCQNVVSGKQTVTIYKPINELAQKAAEIACSLAQGKSVEEASGTKDVIDNGYGEIPVLWMQPVAVTKRNMDEVIIKSGFHTKDEVYRE